MDSGIRPCVVELCSRESDASLNRADLFPGTVPRFYEVCPAHYQRMTSADDWHERLVKIDGSVGRGPRQKRVVVFDDGTDGLGGSGYAAY